MCRPYQCILRDIFSILLCHQSKKKNSIIQHSYFLVSLMAPQFLKTTLKSKSSRIPQRKTSNRLQTATKNKLTNHLFILLTGEIVLNVSLNLTLEFNLVNRIRNKYFRAIFLLNQNLSDESSFPLFVQRRFLLDSFLWLQNP